MANKDKKTSTSLQRMITSLILLLGFCLSTKAGKFDEAECRPRLTVVPLDQDHKYKPYHILLYRCSGTYNKVSPNIKTCGVVEQHNVMVEVADEHGVHTKLTVKNHTKCGAQCAFSSCGENMIMEDCTCHCLTGDCPLPGSPDTSKVKNDKRTASAAPPLPYMVGMALVGLFAVFVLVFDAMLCVKKKGFLHTIKHSCCGQAPIMDKNDNQAHQERQEMIRTEKAVHTVV